MRSAIADPPRPGFYPWERVGYFKTFFEFNEKFHKMPKAQVLRHLERADEDDAEEEAQAEDISAVPLPARRRRSSSCPPLSGRATPWRSESTASPGCRRERTRPPSKSPQSNARDAPATRLRGATLRHRSLMLKQKKAIEQALWPSSSRAR